MGAKATIIPIAGGKGGVGKTFFTANLGMALAECGHDTVVVDMDLGGSNLYSFLGLPNQFPGIGDFLKARSAELEEMLVPTEMPHLKFLPGDGLSPFLANIPHAQKIRLLSRIVKLPAKYILLDLGAGTSFNTLDAFRLSPRGILVTTPEYPSVMNMLTFLKHFILRVIEVNLAKKQWARDLLRSLYKQPITNQRMDIESIRLKVAALDPEAGEKVKVLCRKIRPRIVFNMGEHPDEIKLADQINSSLKKNLSLEADYFGFVFSDAAVRESVKKKEAFLGCYRDSMAAASIERVAERIVNFWDVHIENSSQLMLSHAKKVYQGQARPSAKPNLGSRVRMLFETPKSWCRSSSSSMRHRTRNKPVHTRLPAQARISQA